MAHVRPKVKPKAKRKPQKARELPERLPVAAFKAQFSRYLREVQTHGQAITITMHGRDVAVLSPPKETAPERVPLKIRPRLDPRPFSEIIKGLRLLPEGQGASDEAIQKALDETREDRF
jgi:prevent-host-death family protein